MEIFTDDEVYRVDSVWLGPPKATFPWRWRYVDYGVFLGLYPVLLIAVRHLWPGISGWVFVWPAVVAALLVKFVARKISPERRLGAVLVMLGHELRGPRASSARTGSAASASRVRVRAGLPERRSRRKATTARPRSVVPTPAVAAAQHGPRQPRPAPPSASVPLAAGRPAQPVPTRLNRRQRRQLVRQVAAQQRARRDGKEDRVE